MRPLRHILYISLIILLFAGCKKYEEGYYIGTVGAKQRISGYWDIKTYNVNNHDSLNIFTQNIGNEFYFYLDKPSSGVGYDYIDIYSVNDSTTIPQRVVWNITDDKKFIEIKVNSHIESKHSSLTPFFSIGEYKWEIMKLTRKEFNIESTINGLNYRLELQIIK